MCSVDTPDPIPPQVKLQKGSKATSVRTKKKKKKASQASGLKQLTSSPNLGQSISDMLGGLTIGSKTGV